MAVSNDREVFERFVGNPDLSVPVGLLAFAKYAESKYEWETHIAAVEGQPPAAPAIERWIKDHSEIRLEAIARLASALWDDAATAYMAGRISEEPQAAKDEAIVAEVRSIRDRVDRTTSVKSTFWAAVGGGVLSSLIFTILVIVAGLILEKDPSPFGLLKRFEVPVLPIRPNP